MDYQEAMDTVVPLIVIDQEIAEHTMRRPSAVMWPLSFYPYAETWRELPIIRGDRFALIYEAP